MDRRDTAPDFARGRVSMPGDLHGSRDVYFEFTSIGGTVKVVAIDAASGTEVTVLGPARTPQGDLQRLALKKLMLRLAREA